MTTIGEMNKKKDYKAMLKGRICAVEVSGESCANCATLLPVLKSIADARGIPLVHVEADADTAELMREWEIDRVPTVLLTDDGEIFARCSGFQPEEILELWIDAKMEEHGAGK